MLPSKRNARFVFQHTTHIYRVEQWWQQNACPFERPSTWDVSFSNTGWCLCWVSFRACFRILFRQIRWTTKRVQRYGGLSEYFGWDKTRTRPGLQPISILGKKTTTVLKLVVESHNQGWCDLHNYLLSKVFRQWLLWIRTHFPLKWSDIT